MELHCVFYLSTEEIEVQTFTNTLQHCETAVKRLKIGGQKLENLRPIGELL